MYQNLEQRLDRLIGAGKGCILAGGRQGVEKECLRVDRHGHIAQTPHPEGLGSALTHPYITTDYSEALLELITPPLGGPEAVMDFLCSVHQYVYSQLEDEQLWVTSMPCLIAGELSIPIANYGSSNVGTMKHVYRRGLGFRYGRSMQAIAGVHFNYSLPEAFWPVYQEVEGDARTAQEFISDQYFRLIRNFQRCGWLIPYLFGASPAVCKSFFKETPDNLDQFDSYTYYGEYATSLRMSDIGYKNPAQQGLKISYNDLESYVRDLTHAIETPYPEYESLGVVVDGKYRQLNANILQIENEYYSFVRPKQVAQSGEKPTLALKRRGVQYVEIRALDVDLFTPVGVNEDQLRFMEAFLLFCLLQDSPPVSPEEQGNINENQQMVACCGRTPDLGLLRNGSEVPLKQWAHEIYDAMLPIAACLDHGVDGSPYTTALEAQRPAIEDPEQTPSARVLAEMRDKGYSFFQFAMEMCRQHKQFFNTRPLTTERKSLFEGEAEQSIGKQAEIEAADELSFDEYLQQYFAQS